MYSIETNKKQKKKKKKEKKRKKNKYFSNIYAQI